MENKTFKVPKISCGHCTATIERELRDLEGVAEVSADKDTKEVVVKWEAPADWDRIKSTLDEIGFSAE